jgi:hypothetical protein
MRQPIDFIQHYLSDGSAGKLTENTKSGSLNLAESLQDRPAPTANSMRPAATSCRQLITSDRVTVTLPPLTGKVLNSFHLLVINIPSLIIAQEIQK